MPMSDRPITTLFMLMSADGKISTGADDARDFDNDLPTIVGLCEGLKQYYDLEERTDWHSFNSGRVMAKGGWNEQKESIDNVAIVVAPVLVGGADTPTLVDGESLKTAQDLALLKPMKLVKADVLNNSYLHLQYTVANNNY